MMKKKQRRVSVVADVLAIIALAVYVFVDNTTVDVACGIVIIFACIMEIVYQCTRKKHTTSNS